LHITSLIVYVEVAIFWAVTPCKTCSTVLWNVGILPHITARCHNPEDGDFNLHRRESRLASKRMCNRGVSAESVNGIRLSNTYTDKRHELSLII